MSAPTATDLLYATNASASGVIDLVIATVIDVFASFSSVANVVVYCCILFPILLQLSRVSAVTATPASAFRAANTRNAPSVGHSSATPGVAAASIPATAFTPAVTPAITGGASLPCLASSPRRRREGL